MINLGDDGGNVCTILSSLFDNMISFFNLKDKNSLSNALQNLPNTNLEKNYLKEITIDKRVKKIIELFD